MKINIWKYIDCVIFQSDFYGKKTVPIFGKHDIITREIVRDGKREVSEECKRCTYSRWYKDE